MTLRDTPDWTKTIGLAALGTALDEADLKYQTQEFDASIVASGTASATWVNLSAGKEAQLLGAYFSSDDHSNHSKFELLDVTNSETLFSATGPGPHYIDLKNLKVDAGVDIQYSFANQNPYVAVTFKAGLMYITRKVE